MFVAKIAAAAAFLATAMAQSGMVNTPASLQQCQPASISWTVTKAPFFLSVIPGGQASAAALVDFGSQTASPYVWTPALAVGTSVTIKLIDGDGNPYYSSPVTIQAGSSTACLNSTAGAATTGATSASAAVSSAAGSATAAVSSAASSAAGVVSSVRSSAASAASSAASAASSAASAAASSVTGARTSGASTSAAASAAASSGAATKMEITGFGAVILGAIGAIVAL